MAPPLPLIAQALWLSSLGDLAHSIGGVEVPVSRGLEVARRNSPDAALRIISRYGRWLRDSLRRACPECGGSGLMTYPFVGDDCPCMTCSTDGYERGRGWIDTTKETS